MKNFNHKIYNNISTNLYRKIQNNVYKEVWNKLFNDIAFYTEDNIANKTDILNTIPTILKSNNL